MKGDVRTIIAVSAELGVASSRVLERALARLQGVGLVVVDLRGVTFIDSTGLGVLVASARPGAWSPSTSPFPTGRSAAGARSTTTGC
ncbi:MAG: STAS domain-containing protein [Solirubrobacteraceae bacterium]